MVKSERVEREFVLYVLSGGSRTSHGGPYPSAKAREVRRSMKRHIERGDYRDWNIPEDATDVITVPESERRAELETREESP